jgi:hypothetical protein
VDELEVHVVDAAKELPHRIAVDDRVLRVLR